MSFLLHSIHYVCHELFLKFEQQFLFHILWFMLIDLLGNFYGCTCMIDSSFILTFWASKRSAAEFGIMLIFWLLPYLFCFLINLNQLKQFFISLSCWIKQHNRSEIISLYFNIWLVLIIDVVNLSTVPNLKTCFLFVSPIVDLLILFSNVWLFHL
jgi:hypothetical protein